MVRTKKKVLTYQNIIITLYINKTRGLGQYNWGGGLKIKLGSYSPLYPPPPQERGTVTVAQYHFV